MKVQCTYCLDFFHLCPQNKTLWINLMNHLEGMKHKKAVWKVDNNDKATLALALCSSKHGRPAISSSSLGVIQLDLHTWFKHVGAFGQPGKFCITDRNALSILMCWGWWIPMYEYASNVYAIKGLLHDNHMDKLWYAEAHTIVEIDFYKRLVKINGMFRHKECTRFSVCGESFVNIICSMSAQIP
jgi:hypothetical protein